MILILDDNQFRRRDTFNKLRLNGYMVSAQDVKTGTYFTKPFLTVYINPTNSQIGKIPRENTKCLVIKSSPPDKLPPWIHYIPLGKNIDYDIEKFFWTHFKHENPKKISTFGCICVKNNEIAIGGVKVYLRPKPLRIAKFFIYNNQKKFSDFEVATYFRFLTKQPEVNLLNHIYWINGRCREMHRPPLITIYKNTFWLNNDYIRYNLQYCNDCYDDFLTVYEKEDALN